jgi:ribosomal protein L37AE/L43A
VNIRDARRVAAANARRAFHTCPFCGEVIYTEKRADKHLDRCRAEAKAALARRRYKAA